MARSGLWWSQFPAVHCRCIPMNRAAETERCTVKKRERRKGPGARKRGRQGRMSNGGGGWWRVGGGG